MIINFTYIIVTTTLNPKYAQTLDLNVDVGLSRTGLLCFSAIFKSTCWTDYVFIYVFNVKWPVKVAKEHIKLSTVLTEKIRIEQFVKVCTVSYRKLDLSYREPNREM